MRASHPQSGLRRVFILACMTSCVVTTTSLRADDVPKPKKAAAVRSNVAKREEAKKREEQVRKQQQAAIEAQYKMMGKLTLDSELNFVRASCEVPVELRPKIREAAEKNMDESIKKLAEIHVRPVPGSQRQFPNPDKSLREALQAELKQVLPAAEYAKYESELTSRKESIKHTTVDMIVNRMDQQLWLSDKQRAAITESLNSSWKESNESWISIANYNNQTLPAIPDNVVVPHLTARQKSSWNKTQKIDTSSTMFLNRSWGAQINDPKDDYWEAEEKSPPNNEENKAKPVGMLKTLEGREIA